MTVRMGVKALIVDPIANMPVVILRDDAEKNFLPIWVGVFEANAIALQMEGRHDAPSDDARSSQERHRDRSQGDVVRVVINTLEENTFYAQIHLSVGGPRSSSSTAARRTPSPWRSGRTRPSSWRRRFSRRAAGATIPRTAQNSARLRKWLEEVDPDSLGKYKM